MVLASCVLGGRQCALERQGVLGIALPERDAAGFPLSARGAQQRAGEPGLLRRLGFHFLPLGGSISYFGEVVPYGATLASMRPGYENILDYERTCLIGSASPFRYFRVSAKVLTR